MKWWNRIVEHFNRKYEEEDLEMEWEASSVEDWDWDTLVKDRNLLKMKDSVERQKFIRSCVEQMKNASEELDRVSEEYNTVTAYLKDIEEIEALPSGEAQYVKDSAKKIQLYEKATREYREKKDRLTESQFLHIEKYEHIMPKPYKDIKEAEDYRALIKGDITKLEGEKHAYQYRRAELHNDIANTKGMVMICAMAFAVCMLMLLVLQYGFEMDAQIGYILTIGVGATAVTILYVRYLDLIKQLEKTEKGINRIILLKNTVNIRYVNNKNLLDYLYLKYKVNSGKELLTMWEKYQKEKEERNRDIQNREELDYHKRSLISILRRYQLHDPDIWVYQTAALLDSKEMVEIRHGLVDRRQKLRTQMDYNKRLATEAQKEIKDVIENYPQYKDEILQMVERYEREY
ncbi:MAG: hypothetical protein IKL49_06485 [Lachnospiraceae bacterium]|nr:hypothetical protein [Lachnospiraceae bacterium]